MSDRSSNNIVYGYVRNGKQQNNDVALGMLFLTKAKLATICCFLLSFVVSVVTVLFCCLLLVI